MILKSLAMIGVDVIGPGVSEIAYGADRLMRQMGKSPIPVVSANVPGFAPYALMVKNRGRSRVLVTSVVDPELLRERGMDSRGCSDPAEALKAVSGEIPHDLFIVIIHAEREKIRAILRACPEIDLVVDAVSPDGGPALDARRTPVVANNQEGMGVSYIDYQGNRFTDPVHMRADVKTVAEDPAIKALLGDYEARRASRLSLKKAGPAFAMGAGIGPGHPDFPYAGSQSCHACHADINQAWSQTAHAGALESLTARSRENDSECLACHVTGLDIPGEDADFFAMSGVPETLHGVQCEACHGPGAAHARDPLAAKMEMVTQDTCMRCHTGRRDPDFDYDRDLFQVQHGPVQVGYQGPDAGNRQPVEPKVR